MTMTGTPIRDGDTIVGVICREAMEEVRREPHGVPRWCFRCRAVRDFAWVVTAPVGPSWYGPNGGIECSTCATTDGDLFPGRFRDWYGM